jgi:hypothetical protein
MKETSSLAKILDISPVFLALVNSPTLKKQKNAKRNADLNKISSYCELQILGSLATKFSRIIGVIGSLASERGLRRLQPSFSFDIKKLLVGSSQPLIL